MNPSPSSSSLSAIDQQALDWFSRRQRALTGAEAQQFDAWLRADPAHGAALARWHADWQQLDKLPVAGIDRLRRQLAADQAAANRAAAKDMPAAPGRRHWLTALAPRAALATLALGAGGGGWLAWEQRRQQPLYAASFTTRRGQQQDITLPDGSSIRLDTDTRIDVALYRHRREVRLLGGQAVFHVHGDSERPFDVLANTLRVTVVGTRFAVRHTPGISGAGGVRVAVEEGRVRVARASDAATAGAMTVELAAGQQLLADEDRAGSVHDNALGMLGMLGRVSEVGAAGIAPWRDGRISFDDTPLAQVLEEFGRYGSTGLHVRDPAVAALRLTGTFDPYRLDNFRRVLPRVLPVELRHEGTMTEIAARR